MSIGIPRRKRAQALRPRAETLEMRRLLAGSAFIYTYPMVAREGRDSLFYFGQVYDGWNEHIANKTIDWGDGSPISAPNGGAYYGGIADHHAYAASGTYYAKVTATIHVDGQSDYVVSGVSRVDITPQVFVAENEGPLYLRTGQSTGQVIPVGFVTDITSPESTFQATIDWGDGSGPGPATVSKNSLYPVAGIQASINLMYNGGTALDVHSNHVFASAGNYVAHVVINGSGLSKSFDVPVVVADGSVYVHADPSAPTTPGVVDKYQQYSLGLAEDLAAQYQHARPVPFTTSIDWGDGSYAGSVPFTTSIDWGDGSAADTGAAFAIHAGIYLPAGHINIGVFGGHKYRAPGDYTATLTVIADDGTTSTLQTQLHVVVETFTITPSDPIEATQGVTQQFEIATGLDTIDNRDLNRFQGSIDWGDGSSPTFIGGGGGGIGEFVRTADGGVSFKILVPHTYAKAGSYDVKFVLRGDANVTDGPILAGGGRMTINVHSYDAQSGSTSGTVGTSIGGNQIATVTIPGQDASPANYTATVDWGDGSAIENATIGSTQIAGANGTRTAVTIGGSHAYGASGTYTFKITITDASGDVRVVTGTATIADDPSHTLATSGPTPPPGHYVVVSRYGHPDSVKKVWMPIKAKAAHPGHRKSPRHAHKAKVNKN